MFVEINRGSRVKYDLDKPTGLLRADRILYASMYYEELVSSVFVRARVVGVIRTRDEKGQDDKLIAVHIDDPFLADVHDLAHLTVLEVEGMRRFCRDYKALEGKPVTVEPVLGRDAAVAVLRGAVSLYDRHRDELLRS